MNFNGEMINPVFSNQYERFRSLHTLPLAMSTDTEMVHTAFMNQPTLGFSPAFPLGTFMNHQRVITED